jgi:hypothetical protein
MPINYQLGKIYKIECNITGLVYVGSTCEPILARRLAGHLKSYKCYLKNNGKTSYISSFEIIKNGDYDIILIEKCPCDNKDELHARERYHTNQIECVNKIKNQGLFIKLGEKEYSKQYNLEHQAKIQKTNQQYCKDNKAKLMEKHYCECGGRYSYCHKVRHEKSKRHQKYVKIGL